MRRPRIVQGGMGIGISDHHMAWIVAMTGEAIGTVSCTAGERILANVLQLGDPGGHYLRAFEHFPIPEIAERTWKKWFIKGGKDPNKKFKEVPLFTLRPKLDLIDLTVMGSFAPIWLAKEGHDFPVSVNYLEKLQAPHPFALFGALCARVNKVTMGAGIPRYIPALIEKLLLGELADYPVVKRGSTTGNSQVVFDVKSYVRGNFPKDLERPGFMPIVASNALAERLHSQLPGQIDSFIIEGPTAGGHNAPPRGNVVLDETGQPIYGPRDEVDLKRFAELGVPFYIAGGFASPEGLAYALSQGAAGIQAGSIFALSDDSGMHPELRRQIRYSGFRGDLVVRTDPLASPTGYPFKVIELEGTNSVEKLFLDRPRACTRMALQELCERESDGKEVWRCAAEPVDAYVAKGGKIEDTVGRKCLCNALFANAVVYTGKPSLPILTLGDPGERWLQTMGDNVGFLQSVMKDAEGKSSRNGFYTAPQAVSWLLSGVQAA